jgi:hypothetical protein
MLIKFFHHFFNPHCDHCAHERACQTCEVLKEELANERANYKKLLDTLVEMNKPKVIEKEPEVQLPQEIAPKAISWRIRKEMLEAEDRARAAVLRREKEEVDASEKREAV